jgi:adenine phosphoribosyltransferase
MKILKNLLKYDLPIRTEKNFPIEGIEFIDIMPIFMDNKVINDVSNIFYNLLKDKNIDYIVAPEARGFILGSIVANKLNCGFIPVRKCNKLPPTTIESNFDYEKEYGKDTLALPKLYNDSYINKKVYIIDDIYATGNTVKAIEKELNKLRLYCNWYRCFIKYNRIKQ